MSTAERVTLDSIKNIIAVGEALLFVVFDALGRLLLNQSQIIGSERQ